MEYDWIIEQPIDLEHKQYLKECLKTLMTKYF